MDQSEMLALRGPDSRGRSCSTDAHLPRGCWPGERGHSASIPTPSLGNRTSPPSPRGKRFSMMKNLRLESFNHYAWNSHLNCALPHCIVQQPPVVLHKFSGAQSLVPATLAPTRTPRQTKRMWQLRADEYLIHSQTHTGEPSRTNP